MSVSCKYFFMLVYTSYISLWILSLPYLGDLSLQTRTKLRKSFKGILNCCKFQIVFKSYRKLANVFGFKDRLPFNLVSGVIYKYTYGRCISSYYGETDRHLKVRSAEHTGIPPLTVRKVKPSKRLQFVTIFLIAIISHPLMSLPPWQSKNACLLSVIGLSSIRILVLLNCFFLTITRTLNNFIIP